MGNERTIWFQIEKGEHQEAMILTFFIVPKGHKEYFQIFLLSQDNNWMEQTPKRNSHKPISVYF